MEIILRQLGWWEADVMEDDRSVGAEGAGPIYVTLDQFQALERRVAELEGWRRTAEDYDREMLERNG